MAAEYQKRLDPKVGTAEITGIIVGRNKKVVPPQEVERLAAIGCKDKEISDWFGIDPQSLRYNFREQLTVGRENLKQSLRRAQLRAAMNGNVTMLIWLGKNILGQSENGSSNQAFEPLPWNEVEVTDIEVGEVSTDVMEAIQDPKQE